MKVQRIHVSLIQVHVQVPVLNFVVVKWDELAKSSDYASRGKLLLKILSQGVRKSLCKIVKNQNNFPNPYKSHTKSIL